MPTKTTIYTRPSTSVDFPPNASPALQAHMNATYRSNPAKLLTKTQAISEDLLSLTITQEFADQAAMDEFDNDPQRASFKADRDAYIAANGITVQNIVS